MKKSKIMDGHKKIGKKFVAPMMQLPNLKCVGYVDNILPELIWIGLINEEIGFVPGARFIEKIFRSINTIDSKETLHNFAYASSFEKLSIENKILLISKFEELDILNDLKKYIAPLTLLYDNFPLNFIGPPLTVFSKEYLIKKIFSCVDKCRDKYSVPGLVLIGSHMIFRLVTGRIKFAQDMKIPDFNTIISNPDSDEAKLAAGFLRSSILTDYPMAQLNNNWPKFFWNHNYKLSPCLVSNNNE